MAPTACLLPLLALAALVAVTRASHEAAGDWGEVVLVHVLHRHGDRAPKITFPNDPYRGNWSLYWPDSLGQMTQVGFDHGLELGQFLRARYGDLLPARYNRSNILVQSTYSDRTLQTAECLLSGLYPPLKNATGNVRWQPVPIFTMPSAQDYILEVPTCSLYDEVGVSVADTDEIKCVEERISKIEESITKFSGSSDWSDVYDVFLAQLSLNLPLPDWASQFYPDILSALWSWTRWLPTKLQQKFATGNLIGEMTSHMGERINGTLDKDRKMYIYASRDTSLANFMSALQAFNFIPVPFTAALMVELRLRSPNDYAVAVWYRNTTAHEPYLLTLEGCQSLCPFETFVNLTSSLVPTDYVKECNESLPKNYKVELLKPGKNPLWDGCI